MSYRRLWLTLIFLFLIASLAYAGTITVNSVEDTNARDDVITLREAILISEGSLAFGALTATEQDQVLPPVGSGIADTIDFSISGTIMLTSGLPHITDGGTVIDANSQWSGLWPGGQPGVVLDGTNAGNTAGLMIFGAANCQILGLFITNFERGIWLFYGVQSSTIGGTGTGNRNVISGNNGFGVIIESAGTANNMIKGNYIGTDVTGTRDLGNTTDGILIIDGAHSNTIGGTGTGERNIVAFNKRVGVFVVGDSTDFNTISGNSIHDNGWLGIDVWEGGNDGIVPPDIIWYYLAGDILTISGDTVEPNATIEVFKADPWGEEGQTFLGSLTVDGNGGLSGTLSVAGKEISVDDALIATITDTRGNTSEYSRPLIWTELATRPQVPVLVNIDGRRLSVGEGGILYHDGKPFRAIGVNYNDVFDRILLKPNNTTYRWGFTQLAMHGIPFVRFMATTHWSINLAMYEDDRETYLKRLDGVIQAAEDYGIGLIPSFFWQTWTVPDLVGEPLNQWGNPSSKTMAFMHRYTEDIVSRYKDSPAIWAWEFGNEFNLLADLPDPGRPAIIPELGTPLTRGPADDLTTDMIVVAFKEFAEVVRSIDPTRPIITGNAGPREHAEDIRLGHAWSELDTRDEFKANISLVTPSPCDMVSIHIGDDVFHERFAPGYHPSYDDIVSLAMEASVQNGKALFVGEMSVSDYIHGLETAAPLMQEMLDVVVEHDVPLAAVWVFDMPVSDDDSSRGRNIRPPNTRMYLLEAIRDANGAISDKLVGDQDINYPWDVNGNGRVDVSDIVFVARYFGKNVTAPLYLNPDVNGDRTVGILDIILVAKHFGEVYSPAAPSKDIWKVDREHLPLLTRIYNTMEENPRSDPDFLATRSLLQRLISDTRVNKTDVFQNYPNPFNPDTWIPYQLRDDSDVIIKIYTSTGRLVRTLDLGHKSAGIYISKEKSAYWNGKNAEGEKTASGIYFYNIQAGDFTATKKMAIVE